MKWSDLESGDKIRFTDKCVDWYKNRASDWARRNEEKIFTVSGTEYISNCRYPYTRIYLKEYAGNYLNILDNGYGSGWDYNGELIEIVSLGEK